MRGLTENSDDRKQKVKWDLKFKVLLSISGIEFRAKHLLTVPQWCLNITKLSVENTCEKMALSTLLNLHPNTVGVIGSV